MPHSSGAHTHIDHCIDCIAPQGLMRAAIDAREFADSESRTIHLDGGARAHVTSLAARGPLADPSLSRFSYSKSQ